ncbi:MAG: hypothetical protein FH749_13580 [Firmicutes bacterium]|nr:hypothetical protein [Bacillota bacterium]
MTSLVFFRKEVREIFRTYKIYAVPVIFLLFGFASPLITVLLPEMMESMLEDMLIQLPEMTWIDSMEQLFSNLNQIGLLAVIITMMGTVADEKAHGVSLLVLTKPLTRPAYILAKFFANLLLVLSATALAFIASYYYTIILFEGTEFLPALSAIGLFGVYATVIVALTVFCSAIAKSMIAAGGLAIGGLMVLSILPSSHTVFARYSPAALLRYQSAVLTGTAETSLVWSSVAVSLGTAVILLLAAILIFSRQEL